MFRSSDWRLTAVLLVAWAWLTQRLWFVCDDAWISFRYSRNWAAGLGPVYNPGTEPPVEGYSNFAWMALAAVVEAVGADPGVWMPRVSATCGAILLVLVVRTARGLGQDTAGVLAAGGLLALSPSFATWSTGGLATMPAALALFVLVERLLLSDARRAWVGAAAAAVALSLLRTEGPAWVVVVTGLAAALRWRRRDALDTPWWRPSALVLAVTLPVVAVHVAWRWSFYGDVVSNTARAKVGFGLDRLLRGLKHVAAVSVLLVTPLAAVVGVPAALRVGGHRGLGVLLFAAAVPAYVVAVGGDYMAFGRLLVAGLPFAALLVGYAASEGGLAARVLIVGVLGLGVLPGFGVELAPESWRQALRFRQNFPRLDTEYESWRFMDANVRRWRTQGLALQAATPEGASIVTGAIGARGYFSERHILDRGGLVNREVNLVEDDAHDPLAASPGHDRIAPRSFFLPWEPDVLQWDVEMGTTSARRLAKSMRSWGRGRSEDGYGPRAVKVEVDGRPAVVLLLQRAADPDQASAWWGDLDTHLETVLAGPVTGRATDPHI